MLNFKHNTLIDVLDSCRNLSGQGITFIGSNQIDSFMSYKYMYVKASNMLGYFQQKGIKKGDEVVFQLRSNQDFIVCFWACILGGMIPVPLSVGNNYEGRLKVFEVWKKLNNPWLIGSIDDIERIHQFAKNNMLSSSWDEIEPTILSIEEAVEHKQPGNRSNATADDLAYIQFSSGSTASPKGVSLTHRNLLANIDGIHGGINSPSEGDLFFSWMPLTHDMGLIGFHLTPMAMGWQHYVMPTELFIRHPNLWIKKISDYQITFTASPNFGYKYVLKHLSKLDTENINLSNLRIIVNGAEPISTDLCAEFNDKFKPFGLRENAIFPVYGLAEACLAVTFSNPGSRFQYVSVDRNRLNIGESVHIMEGDETSTKFVNVGNAVAHTFVKIVDEQGKKLVEGKVGRILISGINVTSCYYNDADATKKAMVEENWLDTGDLGFVLEDNLFVTGRKKDIVFVNGQNYYPHDIEAIVESVDEVELGKVAVGGFFNPSLQRDELLMFILFKKGIEKFVPLATSCKQLVNKRMGLEIDNVIPIKKIPKTTSGKIKRQQLVNDYLAGHFEDESMKMRHFLTAESSSTVIPSENPTEKSLTSIVNSVLNTDSFGLTDDFFEFGCDSLRANELALKISEEFNKNYETRFIFDYPTIVQTVTQLSKLDVTERTSIDKAPQLASYPISNAQENIYYQWQLDKNSLAYNLPIALKIQGSIAYDKLKACFSAIIDRYEALRTSFVYIDETPRQIVESDYEIDVDEINCQPSELDIVLKGLIKPFDLENGPLCRMRCLDLQAEEAMLFFDFHHSIADGTSIVNFVKEFVSLYHDAHVETVDIQLKDFAMWETSEQHQKEVAVCEPFWLNQFSTPIPQLCLPLDFPRPAFQNKHGAREKFQLGTPLTSKLKLFAKANGVTMQMLLLTVYKILLAKLGGQSDLVVGVPSAGRGKEELLGAVGMFVNNLSIRSFPSPEKEFIAYLNEVKQLFISCLEYQNYPFKQLVEKTGNKMDPSRNPLFDTMFVYHNISIPKILGENIVCNPYPIHADISRFDLTFEFFEEDHVLDYSIEYATQLFESQSIRNLSQYFQNLIHCLIIDPNQKIADLTLLNDHQYNDNIYLWNEKDIMVESKSILEMVDKCVNENPEAIAIEAENKNISYASMDQKANQIADMISRRGVRKGQNVAIILDRSPEMIISVLAVLKAGGTYVPIEGSYPENRVGQILEDSCPSLVISNNYYNKKFTTVLANNKMLFIQDYRWICPVKENVDITYDESSLAYILYTSGTTGKPKGVMVTNANLVNYVTWAKSEYGNGVRQNYPLFTSVSFDLTVTSMFMPLVTGGKIVSFKGNDHVENIQTIFSNQSINAIKLTPSHLKIIANLPTESIQKCGITTMVVGGESLASNVAEMVINKCHSNLKIYNEYGPTEATVGCMTYCFDPMANHNTAVPIGHPINNTFIYLLDESKQPVADGVEGEIFISGTAVTKGYWTNPDLTNERFLPDPFRSGEVMYKTGDKARRQHDGELNFIGRNDDQINLNGFRIEPNEIVKKLSQFAGVGDAVVVLVDKTTNPSLCAYYTADAVIDKHQIKEFLVGSLPNYMIPSNFVRLDHIPTNLNGKVDFNSLPKPVPTSESYVAPVSDLQRQLTSVMEEVLNKNQVGIHDNFYELGGDSIKALQISSRLYNVGINLEVNDILSYPTVMKMTFAIEKITTDNSNLPQFVEGKKVLTPIDNWFLNQNLAVPEHYCQSVLLTFSGRINEEYLNATFLQLINYHDGLRLNVNAGSQMVIGGQHIDSLPPIERHRIQSIHNIDEITRLGNSIKGQFDLAQSLLIKCVIIEDEKGNERCLMIAHHLVIDGISWRILLQDIYTCYSAFMQGNAAKLPRKRASIIEWSNLLKEYKDNQFFEKESDYWRQQQSDFKLPLNNSNSDWLYQNRSEVVLELNEAQTQYLNTEAHKIYNTNTTILLLVALVRTLRKWTGQDDIVIEMENHGRYLGQSDFARTIGWFTCIYPTRFNGIASQIGDEIKMVKEKIKTIPNNGLGYGLLNNYYGDETNKLTEVRFNHLGQFEAEIDNNLFSINNQPTGHDISPKNKVSAKLEINSFILVDKLIIKIGYDNVAFASSTIEKLKLDFDHQLNNILSFIKTVPNVQLTPSDFDGASLNESDLKKIFQ